MRVIIAGSRNIDNYDTVKEAIKKSGFEITTVISGGARGVDRLGEKYYYENNLKIQIFPADWNQHGKSAGYIRNKKMIDVADALIAVWDGQSKGTKHTINLANEKGIPVFILNPNVKGQTQK